MDESELLARRHHLDRDRAFFLAEDLVLAVQQFPDLLQGALRRLFPDVEALAQQQQALLDRGVRINRRLNDLLDKLRLAEEDYDRLAVKVEALVFEAELLKMGPKLFTPEVNRGDESKAEAE